LSRENLKLSGEDHGHQQHEVRAQRSGWSTCKRCIEAEERSWVSRLPSRPTCRSEETVDRPPT